MICRTAPVCIIDSRPASHFPLRTEASAAPCSRAGLTRLHIMYDRRYIYIYRKHFQFLIRWYFYILVSEQIYQCTSGLKMFTIFPHTLVFLYSCFGTNLPMHFRFENVSHINEMMNIAELLHRSLFLTLAFKKHGNTKTRAGKKT